MNFVTTIGLEVHAQLLTKTKLFCRCENSFGKEANTHTCPICLGLPGALPVLNEQAVTLAIRTGLALHCKINQKSIFARKNYFYPDLPKGYQISQYDQPLSTEGYLMIDVEGTQKRVGIHRAHMEEDAGKLLHGDNLLTIDGSLVDLNRAGVPLVEIVSDPDIASSQEAVSYLKKLRSILRYANVCDGNMEEGSFRCDANVSIRPEGTTKLGTRTEIKNVNSFKHVQKAIEFEISRQAAALTSGEKIVQETRLWNPDKGITVSMRSKEEAHDYRYFPEPDLLPLEVEQKWVNDTKKSLPEMPDDRRQRFQKDFGLPFYDADVLTAEKETADYFEETIKSYGAKKSDQFKNCANVVSTVIGGIANSQGLSMSDSKFNIKPDAVAFVLNAVDSGQISSKMAKQVYEEISTTGKNPKLIIESQGLAQISDRGALLKIVRGVIAENPGQVVQYKSGKEKLFGFFVGQVMKATQGQGNPNLVNDLLKEELSK